MYDRSGDTAAQRAEFEAWGVPEEEISEALHREPLGIYPENWDAVQLFLRVQSQWYFSGLGQRTGLNYSGVETAARLLGYNLTPDLFDQVQNLELAAIKELNSSG